MKVLARGSRQLTDAERLDAVSAAFDAMLAALDRCDWVGAAEQCARLRSLTTS